MHQAAVPSVIPPAKGRTYLTLQAGRGIAAIMVVIFHTTSFLGGDPRYWHLRWLSIRFTGLSLGVDYFFVLSGTVILLAHRKDIGHPATIPSYLWKRFRRVYPIYWLVLTTLVLEYTLRPGLGAPWQKDASVILSGYLLISINTLHTTLPVAWTLFHEVLFYAIFAVLLASRRIGLILLALWCALSILMLIHPWNLFCLAYLFSPLHLLFASGMLVARLLYSGRLPGAVSFTILGACIFLAAIVIAGVAGDQSFPIQLLAGAGATFLVLGAARLEARGHIAVSRSLRFAGDASYSIYLIHYPFFMFSAPIVYKLCLRFHIPVAVPFVVLPVCAVAVGCGLHVLIERPLLRLIPRRKPRLWASA